MSALEELFSGICPNCTTDIISDYKEDCTPIWQGKRINELLLVPCTEIVNDTIVLDTQFWTSLFCGSTPLGRRSGVGLGDIQGTNGTPIDTGANCGIPTLTNVKDTYQLTFIKRTFDESEQYLTHKFYSELKKGGWDRYKIFARMCDSVDEILPIGRVALTKNTFTMPQGIEDVMQLEIGLSWKQNDLPTPIKVVGLDAALQCDITE
jgi:hypothetical protein